jgi:hypothetical protein
VNFTRIALSLSIWDAACHVSDDASAHCDTKLSQHLLACLATTLRVSLAVLGKSEWNTEHSRQSPKIIFRLKKLRQFSWPVRSLVQILKKIFFESIWIAMVAINLKTGASLN